MITTLCKIKQHSPCEDMWGKLLKHLGKTESDDEPLSLLTILESNGVNDTTWAFRSVDGFDREIRLFACWCACQALPLFESEFPNDPRPRMAIEAAILRAEGLETTAAYATYAAYVAYEAAATYAAADTSADTAAAYAAACAAYAAYAAADTSADTAAAYAAVAYADTSADTAADTSAAQKEELIKMITEGKNYYDTNRL